MLANKTVLISGSSTRNGIGVATARLAKKYGATVILHGREESAELSALAAELDARYIVCDVADGTAVSAAFQSIPVLDVLVNCAGMNSSKAFSETDDEEWITLFRVNLLGTMHFCKAALPLLRHSQGRIVNVASLRGVAAIAGHPAYSASKAAVINFTSSLAKELAPTVAVNAVAPGFVKTDMAKTWSEEVQAECNRSLLGRPAEPSEIGEAICFLASERASFITGEILIVDGGYRGAGK